jgi:hypothetical protein
MFIAMILKAKINSKKGNIRMVWTKKY